MAQNSINYARQAAKAWKEAEILARKDPVCCTYRAFTNRLSRHLRPKIKPGWRLCQSKQNPYQIRISSPKFHRQYLIWYFWNGSLIINVDKMAAGPPINTIAVDVNDPKCFEIANQALVKALTGLCINRIR